MFSGVGNVNGRPSHVATCMITQNRDNRAICTCDAGRAADARCPPAEERTGGHEWPQSAIRSVPQGLRSVVGGLASGREQRATIGSRGEHAAR